MGQTEGDAADAFAVQNDGTWHRRLSQDEVGPQFATCIDHSMVIINNGIYCYTLLSIITNRVTRSGEENEWVYLRNTGVESNT